MSAQMDAAVDPVVALAAPRETDVCLDYGCGVGQAACAVAPFVRRVEAVDDNPEVLHEAERLGAELGCQNVSFRRCDLLALPYSDGSFDLVLCRMVLHTAVEPLAPLAEMTRVLTPDGRLIVYDALVDESTDRYFNELARLREPGHWRHYRLEEYEELFRQAGLRETGRTILRESVDLDAWAEAGLATPGHLDLLRSRLRSYPLAAQLALDAAYADQRASFSFDVLVARLER